MMAMPAPELPRVTKSLPLEGKGSAREKQSCRTASSPACSGSHLLEFLFQTILMAQIAVLRRHSAAFMDGTVCTQGVHRQRHYIRRGRDDTCFRAS